LAFDPVKKQPVNILSENNPTNLFLEWASCTTAELPKRCQKGAKPGILNYEPFLNLLKNAQIMSESNGGWRSPGRA
jgi:hypothetical protein